MERKWKVVVTDWEYPDLRYEEAVLNHDSIELIPAQCFTEEQVIAACHDADALISQYAPLNRKVLEALKNCKVITRYGVGVDTIDLEAATEKGICVANVPDYCVDEVSDHALALLLAMARKVPLANHYVKNRVWDFKVTQPIYRIRGKILGLVGFGKIPQALSEKAMAIGLHVISYDPYFPADVAREKGVELVSLEELCQKSDFISVHAPLTSATKGLLGNNQFSLMKNNAIVINTSRGPLIDEKALIDALMNGKISGAALDVIEEEPIHSDNPLLNMENVILTPHVAWYSEESSKELRSKAAMGVVDILLYGEYPKYLVNKQVKHNTTLTENQGKSRYAVFS